MLSARAFTASLLSDSCKAEIIKILKFNENHDERGRFTSGDGSSLSSSHNITSAYEGREALIDVGVAKVVANWTTGKITADNADSLFRPLLTAASVAPLNNPINQITLQDVVTLNGKAVYGAFHVNGDSTTIQLSVIGEKLIPSHKAIIQRQIDRAQREIDDMGNVKNDYVDALKYVIEESKSKLSGKDNVQTPWHVRDAYDGNPDAATLIHEYGHAYHNDKGATIEVPFGPYWGTNTRRFRDNNCKTQYSKTSPDECFAENFSAYMLGLNKYVGPDYKRVFDKHFGKSGIAKGDTINAFVFAADLLIAVTKSNPNHAPAGSPEGGQFTSGEGISGEGSSGGAKLKNIEEATKALVATGITASVVDKTRGKLNEGNVDAILGPLVKAATVAPCRFQMKEITLRTSIKVKGESVMAYYSSGSKNSSIAVVATKEEATSTREQRLQSQLNGMDKTIKEAEAKGDTAGADKYREAKAAYENELKGSGPETPFSVMDAHLGNSVAAALLHEYGHAYQDGHLNGLDREKIPNDLYHTWEAVAKQIDPGFKDRNAKTEYAKTSPGECFAENFTAYMLGLDKLVGPDYKKVFDARFGKSGLAKADLLNTIRSFFNA